MPRKWGSVSDGSGYSTLADVPEVQACGLKDERPTIVLRCELMPMTDEAISALARIDGIYQREGFLVDIVPSAEPDGFSRISQVPASRLRELLSSVATCKRRVKGENDSESFVSVAPTKDLISMIIDRRHWPTLRPLNGIARAPIVRPDGTVCTEPGYDAATSLFYEARCQVAVSKSPTKDEATKALARLRGLLADFPFAAPREVSEAAWLAALLTIVGRSAVDAPVPLTLIDASEKGSGKTLLADALGAISQGESLPRQTQPESKEEWKKTMLTIALEAPPLVLFDNVSSKFGSDALDAFLTGTRYQDRLLSKNETVSPKTRTVFVVTANNPSFKQDTIRRSIHVRITPKEERPEQRATFKHPNLLRHIRENRGQYLADALTLLRAYFASGRPPVEMRTMGSYEEWSAVVRAPLIWLGLPDPAETQDELRESADDDRAVFGEFLAAWVAFYGEDQDQGVTAAKLLEDLVDTGERHPKRDVLRAVFCAFCKTGGKLPVAQDVGYWFRTSRDRSAFGLRFERCKAHTRTGTTWRVVRA